MHKDYTTAGERGTATRLVRAAIHAGYTVSVNDGEEWTVRRSTAEREILAALGSTELDYIRFYRGEDSIGTAMLIWGNDETGEELIADYTDNAEMDALTSAAQR